MEIEKTSYGKFIDVPENIPGVVEFLARLDIEASKETTGMLDWSARLITDVFHTQKPQYNPAYGGFYIPSGLTANTLNEVLSNTMHELQSRCNYVLSLLAEEEENFAAILIAIYKYGCPHTKIAKALNISLQAVHAKTKKGLNRLAKERHSQFLVFGKRAALERIRCDGYNAGFHDAADMCFIGGSVRKDGRLEDECFGIFSEYQQGYAEGHSAGFVFGSNKSNEQDYILGRPIEVVFHDNNRLKSVLRRSGGKIVRDVIDMTREQFLLVRNAGQKTLNDFIAALEQYGFNTTKLKGKSEK